MSDWKDWDYLFDDVKGKIDGPINKINHHLPNINKNPKKIKENIYMIIRMIFYFVYLY